MSENNTDLNEVFEEEMDDADVITVPIDETLSNSGEAADAAAVGAALALKADKDELPATIKVNNQPADNQGLILIDGTDIPVSDSNTKTLAEAIEEASEMTAATIPMTGETGATTIGETIGVLQETVEGIAGNMSADKIPMSEAEDAETIAEAIGIIADNVEELEETVEGMEQKTADKVLMETGSTVTVKDAIETLDRTAVKSINRKLPDASGDVDLPVVPLAENLQSDKLQSIEGEFTLRTTGGTGSVSDGKAYPQHIYGNSRHDGFVAEVLNLTVIPIARTEPDEPITATIDRDTFLEEVEDSDTINLYYTTEWSEDPADYGVTVTGDPVAGDQITIVYVKEVRGTIVVAEPDRLVGTGWNLFNYNAGYARVVKYSETYGYKIGGTFTSIAFAASLTDDRISLLPNIDGLFSVPGDGYVFVTGGNNTDTYILTTWSDWIEGPSTGYWEAYRESGIDLSAVVETYFPYGMLKVGTVRDEIDLVAKRTISRIERMVYNEENRATAAATGRAYDFDENNIYVVRSEPVLNAITIDSEYSVSEHGLEWFTETELPLDTEILYGKNLRDKLERNVLTISAQTLTEEEKSQVRTNIGAMSQAEGDTKLVAPTEAGTAGQLLHLKEDGSTEWTTQGTPTDAQVGTAVSAWLDAHPEATTTVEDGAISRAKLNDDLKAKTDAVPDLKSALNHGSDIFPLMTWNTGYVKANLAIDTSSSYRYSDPISILPGTSIDVYSYGYQQQVCHISKCNAYGERIEALVLSDDTEGWKSYVNSTSESIKVCVCVCVSETKGTPIVTTKGINEGEVKTQIANVESIVDDFTTPIVLIPLSEFITRYPTNAYINSSSGAIVPNNGYYICYYTVPADGEIWFTTIPASGVYTACCVYNDTLGTGKKAFYSNSNSNLPTSNTKAKVYRGNVVGISVATSGTFSMQCSAILQINKKNLPNLRGEYVEIVPTDSTKFNVLVYNNEHWYRYYFERKTTIKTIESYEITTMDCWDVSIYDENSANIMQGNFNFIHSLATPTGHAGYVGVGDGCAVIEWATFYADGKPFIPGVTTERIKCSEFRYVTKIKQYLSADATKVTNSTPSLDEQGNPIIESYNMMDCIISVTGVHGRNRMLIQIDNVTFDECHGAMLTGYYPYFDNIVIMNDEMTWNKIVNNDDTLSISLEGGSTINLGVGGQYGKKSDTSIIYGDKMLASCTMRNVVMGNENKTNLRIWIALSGDHRMKTYFMPVVTTHTGEPDTFNTGDIIDVEYEKIIRYSPNAN